MNLAEFCVHLEEERKREAQFHRSHGVDTKQKELMRIHENSFQQLLGSLRVSLCSSCVGCFTSQKPTTKSNTMEISGKTERKKKVEIEGMEIPLNLSYKRPHF